MTRIEKTVFISYRRRNFPWALAVYQYLTNHEFDSFFDFQSINSGDFSRVILKNIKARAHFILLLTPSALDGCERPNDWLRQEIEIALDEKRNIVPLLLDGFDFNVPSTNKYLTGSLEPLKKYNGLRVHSDYFEEAMERLHKRYLNVPLATVLHPISQSVQKLTTKQKRIANKKPVVELKELSTQGLTTKEYKSRGLEDRIDFYTEMIRLDPTLALAYYKRSIERVNKGDLDGAIEDNAKADRLKLDNIEGYKNNIIVRENRRLFDDVLDYYSKDLFKSESARLHWLRGETRYENGDLDGAIADYSETISLESDFPGIYLKRGNIYRSKGNFDNAIADYNKAIELEPDDVHAYHERGLLRQFIGELNGAFEDFTHTILIKPDHAVARTSLIGLLKKLGREAEAKEHEQIALVLIQKEDEYNRACFEAVRGKTDMALKLLEIWLTKVPSSKKWARQDPDFENIHNNPRFKELVSD